jgi:peroxiredoxin
MLRRLRLVFVAALVIAVAGIGAFMATRPRAAPSPPPAAAPRTQERPPPPSGGPEATAPRPRSGRVFSMAEAIKELDLIQPARTKLADDFDVATPKQGSFRLSEYRGKPVMVNFWATWCPPCLEEMPALERLYRRHRDAGFVLVAVSLDANPEKVQEFLTRHHLTFPVGLDPKTRVAELYGVRALPSTFIVDRRGNLSALALGPRAWDNDASHSLVEALIR